MWQVGQVAILRDPADSIAEGEETDQVPASFGAIGRVWGLYNRSYRSSDERVGARVAAGQGGRHGEKRVPPASCFVSAGVLRSALNQG